MPHGPHSRAPPSPPAPSLGSKEDAASQLSGFSHPVLDCRAERSDGSDDAPSSPPLFPEALRAAAGSGRCRYCRCRCRRRRRAGSPEGWGAGAQLGADWAPTFLRSHLLMSACVPFPEAHAAHPGAPQRGPRPPAVESEGWEGRKRREESAHFTNFENCTVALLSCPTHKGRNLTVVG